MNRLALLVAACAVALQPVALAAQSPQAEVDGNSRVIVRGFPSILEEEDVIRHLDSGLTTTIGLRVQVKGSGLVGGARVDVRYELWDEVYQVVAVGIDGRGERRDFEDLKTLVGWWSELQLTVVEAQEVHIKEGMTVDLKLEVIPFSESEQEDTQRWFSRSFAVTRGGEGARITDSAERRGDSLEKVLGVLMATSIQRRAVLSYEWEVTVTGGRDQ